MKISTVRTVRLSLLGGMLLFCILGMMLKGHIVAMSVCCAIAVLAFVARIVISFLYWRCPHCGCMLSHRIHFIQYCPHCGESLDD